MLLLLWLTTRPATTITQSFESVVVVSAHEYVETGIYVLTGQAVRLKAARRLVAEAGSFVLTGQEVNLAHVTGAPYSLPAMAGNFTLTGQAATLRPARKLTAGQGSFVLSGQDANLRRNYRMTAGVGNFTLTGQVATLKHAATVGYDTSTGATDLVVSSLTWSHTCSGTNRLLVVGVTINDGTSESVTGVTYNGVAMTSAGSVALSANGDEVSLWYLVNPASGANNVVATFSATMDVVIGESISFTNVHQATPIGTQVEATGIGTTASAMASSAARELVVDMVGGEDAFTVGAGQTSRQARTVGFLHAAMSTEPGAGTVTMSWTLPSDPWAIVALPIKPIAETSV